MQTDGFEWRRVSYGMRYSLRTLLILLAAVPPMVGWVALRYARQKEAVARERMALLDDAIRIYCLDVGGPPAKLNDLVVAPQIINPVKWAGPYLEHPRMVLDPWNQQFEYKVINSRECKFRVWSNGPDKKAGTPDDIREGD
jgi:hypothetical protein